MTIRMRLTLTYTLILAFTLGGFGWALYVLHGNQMRDEADEMLRIRANEVIAHMEVVEGFPLGLGKYIEIPSFDTFAEADLFIQVMDDSGEIITRSDNLHEAYLPFSGADLEATLIQGSSLQTYYLDGHALRVYITPFYYRNRLVGFVQMATPMEAIHSSLYTLRWVLLLLGGMTLVGAAGIGWWLARSALRPVDRIIQATEAIQEARDLNRRIAIDHDRDEVGRLAQTINEMLARLQSAYNGMEQSIQVQRRFVSDASHELRSPLTSIRGNVEWLVKAGEADEGEPTVESLQERIALYREAWEDIREEAARMSLMVDELLALARSDAKAEIVKGRFPLLPWLEKNIAHFHGMIEAQGRVAFVASISKEISQDAMIYGNEALLDRMLHVLVENALKYTEEGQVNLQAELHGERELLITVKDTGVGISPEDLPHIFERFYRGDRARERTGTGLGLSIAEAVVREHGGYLEVSSEVRQGSTFTVRLPL